MGPDIPATDDCAARSTPPANSRSTTNGCGAGTHCCYPTRCCSRITRSTAIGSISAIRIPASCLLRGVPGTYSRASAETTWRRTFVDGLGQTWTPFVILRGDVGESSISNQPGVANFVETGNNSFVRFMPAVGMEYRYPLINVQP